MTVKELYDSIGGDYQKAIATMMMDAFIIRMLTKFIEKNNYQEIVDAYKDNNFRGVFEGSHSLKGVAGNLALTPLFEKSSHICELTRHLSDSEHVNLDSDMEELKNIYEGIIQKISELIKK